MSSRIAGFVTAIFLSAAAVGAYGQSLNVPRLDSFGQPIDVGLLVLGHSTSVAGDWPAKLAQSLNQTPSDGRHYVVFPAMTNGDGGFLWSRLSVPFGDLQYDRVRASAQGSQWCQDPATKTRYSARRARLEQLLRGSPVIPPACDISLAEPALTTTVACVWHENGARRTQALPFHQCWRKMDVRLALIQDTTNRSFPVDDYTGDGAVGVQDFFAVSAIHPDARACPARNVNPSSINPRGVVLANGNEWIDWDCNNRLDAADAANLLYADWLRRLATDLLTRFDASNAHHVFITQKPVELVLVNAQRNECERWFPGETALCTDFDYHRTRVPTPSRPFSQAYLPPVYWERSALETLAANPVLDPRIHLATPADVEAMWHRSAKCYTCGLVPGDWTIPASVAGRPTDIGADTNENDADRRNADSAGCLVSDHIHHNDAGGWMMADIWYQGLIGYLQ